MIRKLGGLAAIAAIFVSGVASAQTSAMVGTAHDLSTVTGANGQICIVCHAPHNNAAAVADAPLWNHAITGETFTPYASATLDATGIDQPLGVSKLCLSCHDGITAVDSFGGVTRTTVITGLANVGTNLSNDHPISFTYDTTLSTTDGGLEDPATAASGLGGTVSADLLFGGSLECASCHDVHDDTNGNFLRKANTGSALCVTCHTK